MFTPDDLQARIKEQPFVPVRIITTTGQMFDIYHPDLIMIGRRSITVGTASTDNPRQYDQLTRIAILHVTALQDLPVPSIPGGNGR
jgi:hypothetical protein